MRDRRLGPWFDLVGAPAQLRQIILAELSRAERRWHGLLHHRLMLRTLRAGGHPPGTLRRLVLATLFHDIVYDPRATDNEAASAEVARAWLAGEEADAVAALILATRAHDLNTDPVTRALLEADLGVLWTPNARLYAFYADGIRAEYAHVPDAAYRQGRAAVLIGLRDRITPRIDRDRAERLARNIGWELARLA